MCVLTSYLSLLLCAGTDPLSHVQSIPAGTARATTVLQKRKLTSEMPQYVPALTRALCGGDRADSAAQHGSNLVLPSARAVLPSDGGTESPTQPCHVVPFLPMVVPTGSCICFYFSNELSLNNPEEADTEGHLLLTV